MNCPDCLDTLQRRLDGTPATPDAALDRHLAHCATCRDRFAAATRLLAGLRATLRPAAPATLAPRVVAAALRDRRRRRTRVRRSLFLTLALAASVLLMLLAGSFFGDGKPKDVPERGPVAQDNPPKNEIPAPEVQPPEPGPRLPKKGGRPAENRDNLAVLTGRLADKTLDQAKVLWTAANPVELMPNAEMPSVPELDPLDPAAQPLRQAKEEASASLLAVSQSARRAFDYFARELPVLDVPTGNELK